MSAPPPIHAAICAPIAALDRRVAHLTTSIEGETD